MMFEQCNLLDYIEKGLCMDNNLPKRIIVYGLKKNSINKGNFENES
jgi:hypothetical protein